MIDTRTVLTFMMAGTMAVATHAHAAARAELHLSGASSLHQTLYHTGFGFEYQNIPFTVRAGEPQTFHWNYTLRVSDDGLPSTPTGSDLIQYSLCNFIYPTTCPPAPSGYESARAQLLVGHVDGRATPPFLDISGATIDMATARGSESDFISRSGTIDVTVGINPAWTSIMEYSGAFGIISSQWVIASPIPEPTTLALTLAGMAALGLKRRRGAKATQPAQQSLMASPCAPA